MKSVAMALEQLFTACKTGDVDTVESVIASRYADLNTKDEGGLTPLHIAIYSNHPAIVATLLDTAEVKLTVTSDHNGGTGLHGACYFNHVPLIAMFARHKRCTPAILNMKNRAGETALMVAVRDGHLESVKELAQVEGVDFATENNEGHSVMEVAVEKNYQEIVQFLKMREILSA